MRWWRRRRARRAVRRSACVHCGGSGLLRVVVEREPGQPGVPVERTASCHACPAGAAWAEALTAVR